MGNKVKFGLEKVHIAPLDEEAEEQPGWETPEEVPGAVSFSISPEGDETEFYADNTKYFIHETNDGYEGDIEMAKIPDEMLATILGMEIDDNGMLIETVDDDPKEFALMFEVSGDERDRRTVLYRCQAGRPDQEANTNEGSVDPQTDTLPITVMPVDEGEHEGLVKGVIEKDEENEQVYEEFFDEVTLPNKEVTA